MTKRLHPLTDRFFAEAMAKQVHVSRIESRAGLALGTVRHWKDGKTPRIDTLVAALNVIGLDLKIVPKEAEAK